NTLNEQIKTLDNVIKRLYADLAGENKIIEQTSQQIQKLQTLDESKIRIKLLKKGKKAIAVVDGQFKEEINYMEELIFQKSKNKAYFVRLSKDFYKKVREKLIEGGITPTRE
ncbi:MAG: hypothetical protein PHR99_07215, partial [Methanobacteriales archaeon]|nr:hypothetical protein [Methanobacteriales archaeon]